MRQRLIIVCTIIASLILAAGLGYAAAPKQYQYTGTVTDVSNGILSVDKAGDVWQFSTEGAKDLKAKKGDKITDYYKMVVQKVDLK